MNPGILRSSILLSLTLLGGASGVLAQKLGPRITIGPAFTVNEGNGTTQAQFQVSVEGSSVIPIRVSYATAPGTATGGTCGTGGADFGTTTGTLTIPLGQPAGTFTIPICGNIVFEPSETFEIRLSNPQNATLGNSVSVVTIANDDPITQGITTGSRPAGLPSSIGQATPPPDPSQTGEGGFDRTIRIAPFLFTREARNALFPVTVTGPLTSSVTVSYATFNGSAIGGSNCQGGTRDFISQSGTLTFTAGGAATRSIEVFICGGDGDDPDETFTVRLSSATNALIVRDTSTATIE